MLKGSDRVDGEVYVLQGTRILRNVFLAGALASRLCAVRVDIPSLPCV
jgi:hypothetical protein